MMAALAWAADRWFYVDGMLLRQGIDAHDLIGLGMGGRFAHVAYTLMEDRAFHPALQFVADQTDPPPVEDRDVQLVPATRERLLTRWLDSVDPQRQPRADDQPDPDVRRRFIVEQAAAVAAAVQERERAAFQALADEQARAAATA